MVPGQEIKLVSVEIVGRTSLDRLLFLRQKPDLEGRDDRLRDFVLEREDVGELAVVALRPDVIAPYPIDQLGSDAHAPTRLAHAALDDVADVELPGDPGHVHRLAFEGE